MYIPQIKDKYSLVDLTRYGTKARKHVHSDVLIGGHPPVPMFKEGDILDGNATFNLIQCAYDQDRVYKMVSKEINEFETTTNENIDRIEKQTHQSIEDLNNRHTSDVEQINTSLEQVTNDINQCQSDLQETKVKHDQDIHDVYEYVEDNRTMMVYDGLEENLLIYNIKHG